MMTVFGLGDEWKMGCPECPKWESEGEAWSEDESVSSTASHTGNMCNGALHVIGLHGLGDKLSLFLQEWELAKVALSCHMALDMLCQEMHEACHGMSALLSPWTGCVTAEERDVVRGNKWKGSVAGLGGLSGPVGILPFIFCRSVYTMCLFGMSVVFQTCLGVCEQKGRRRIASLCRTEAENSQRVAWVLAFVLKVRLIVLASLRSDRRTSTCEVSSRWSIVACVHKHR